MSMRAIHNTYASLLQRDFSLVSLAQKLITHGFGENAKRMIALQRSIIELAKKQGAMENYEDEGDVEDESSIPTSASEPAVPQWVPLSLANQGPAAVALKLLRDSKSTEEQIDAVALMALSMQKRFNARPDKS